jgi:hypothetical protein
MVQKGKRKPKKPCRRSPKKILLQCGELIYKLPLKGSDIKLQESLLNELKDELEVIYNNYLAELCKRVNSLNFLLESYKLKEFPFRLEAEKVLVLRAKVKRLMKTDQMRVIYNIFYITIHKFLADIQKELRKFQRCPHEIIVMCLAESLNALECSAKELGKITENMPEHPEIEENCENITKIAFYEKILKYYEDVLAQHSAYSDSVILHNMLTLLTELKKTKSLKNFIDEDISRDSSEKSIDEIMIFIDGAGQNQEESQKEQEKMMNLDQEIETFKKRLELSQDSALKMKPNISSEWIFSIKCRINKSKSNN